MRKFIWFVVVFSLSMISCNGGRNSESDQQETAIDSSRLVTVKYHVEGMTCGGCENTVNFAVGEIPGVTEVNSSFKEMYTEVTYDSLLVNPEKLAEVITGRGYTFKGPFTSDQETDAPQELE